MTKDEHIDYWLKSADHDLSAAESLFQAKNMIGVYSEDTWYWKRL